jgi:hypothetical protein
VLYFAFVVEGLLVLCKRAYKRDGWFTHSLYLKRKPKEPEMGADQLKRIEPWKENCWRTAPNERSLTWKGCKGVT